MSDKLAKQLTELIKMKRDLVANLKIKGVVASEDETLETLVPKVLAILQVQGDLTLGAKEIIKDGDYFPVADELDAYSSVSVNIMKDNNALVKFLEVSGNRRFKRVEIKGDVPDYAYNGRTDLKEIYLDGCEEIGQYALNGCTGLAIFNSNEAIKSIGQYALYNCTNAEGEIILDDNIMEVPDYAFYQCLKLKLNIPKSAVTIKQSAYRGCLKLTGEIPSSVRNIGTYAFYNTTNFKAKILPPVIIGSNAFTYSGVEFEEIPKGCTLGTTAFNYCNGLTRLVFNNDGVIPNYCFQYSKNLESIEIGTGITAINTQSFRQCTKLKTITCRSITPPTLIANSINSCPIETIYVPASALEKYKSATNWSVYADKMIGIEGE